MSGLIFFPRLGSGISLSAQTPPKTSRSRFCRKTRVKPPNVVRARKLRNTNTVPVRQNNTKKSLVAPSYGQNLFCWLGPYLTKPNRRNGPQPPPKRAISQAPGTHGTQTGFSGSAFSMQSNLVGGRFTQNGPQDRENPLFGVFGPFGAPDGRKIYLSPPDPQKIQG